ncbi:DoxX family protein [Brevundimonas sp.]|uniref:DoxX family protein n=1 Tax=Brevundimonas sp. TaxID=1871086 RepID=UPI002730466C|nr:DoxX family protein [Brevundimonas sp.]MDP1911997.1 DoxX family protein [Brevundimonas sp.]
MTSQTLSPSRSRLNASYRNLTLWTLQGWIAMFFIAAGYAKLSEPMANLIELMRWPALVAPTLVRGLGIAEIILAVLVLAPLVSWKQGRPLLVMAASGLLALEVVMLAVHATGLDVGPAVTNLVLIAITAPVLWKRAREVRQG